MALQLRRGTNQQRLSMTPANGELIFVTDYALVSTSVTSINTSTETLSTTSAHGLSVNQQVKYIGPTLNGLTANQVYYVKTAPTITSFTLSTSLGGGTVDISGTFTVDLVFAKTPTTAAGAPVGTGVSALWIGDGVTVGGLIAASLNLEDLLDVEFVSLAEGNTLYYDATTGFWRNTTIVTVDDFNSRVGINNATPTQTLDVSGNGQFSGAIYGNNTDNATTPFTGSIQTLGGIGVAKDIFVGGNTTLGNATTDEVTFTSKLINAPNDFRVNAGNHLYVDTSLGFVGIGTDTPDYKLDVDGSLRVVSSLFVDSNTTLGNASGDTVQINASTVAIPNNLNFDSGLLFIDAANNRIGINDSTPSQALDVGGNGQFSGAIYVNGTDQATTTTTGAIQTLGGIGVAKNAFIGGSAYVNNTDNATTAFTGSLQTLGGVGVAKDIFVGGAGTITTDLAVNGGDITTTAATATVFNTTATTLNIGGAATTMSIGNASGTVTIPGNLTVSGTTTTLDTQTLLVEDKNITIGNVAIPSDVTAAGGGITLLGATDKTITWNNATDGWEFNQSIKVTGNAVLSGDLTVGGNDIKSSTDTAMTLSGNDVTVLGDLDVNAGTIGTIAATGNLFNTAATTLNIGGAATAVNIGAATGSTIINADLNVNGTVVTLDANNAGAGNDIYIVANRGSSGTDATAAWLESTGFWTFSNKLYGIDEVVGGTSIGTNGNNIYFNNENGATLADCFITVKRPSDPDPAIKWNESTDRWQTTVDASTYINIPNQALDTTDDANFGSVAVDGVATINTQTTTTTATTATAISTTTRKTQKVVITITDNVTSETHVLEALAGTDILTSTAMLTTYAEMYSSGLALATFTADVSAGSLRILATPASTNSTTFKVARISVD